MAGWEVSMIWQQRYCAGLSAHSLDGVACTAKAWSADAMQLPLPTKQRRRTLGKNDKFISRKAQESYFHWSDKAWVVKDITVENPAFRVKQG